MRVLNLNIMNSFKIVTEIQVNKLKFFRIFLMCSNITHNTGLNERN